MVFRKLLCKLNLSKEIEVHFYQTTLKMYSKRSEIDFAEARSIKEAEIGLFSFKAEISSNISEPLVLKNLSVIMNFANLEVQKKLFSVSDAFRQLESISEIAIPSDTLITESFNFYLTRDEISRVISDKNKYQLIFLAEKSDGKFIRSQIPWVINAIEL
ncbi:hypothetical protein [Dendrosporobacter sp. 1207_IL3150]|uniref:hypothetical protein n=1 Tax=Dendrosporobacter sp. 1207_IL3150 TaxID=3084054 RepID=UPI002FD8F00F